LRGCPEGEKAGRGNNGGNSAKNHFTIFHKNCAFWLKKLNFKLMWTCTYYPISTNGAGFAHM
jgi:hypothetical protein